MAGTVDHALLTEVTAVKVFVSWSKPTSRQLALVLRDWLPEVIQQLEPWMSSEDIDKGQRWATEVGGKLGELGQGILCVTTENLREPWLNFEAGALAKVMDDSRVRPVLLDLQPSDVTGPLAQFQATMATDRDDMFKLVNSLNEACPTPLDATRLERAFDRAWDDLISKVQALRAAPSLQKIALRRSSDDMIAEVLERVRELQRSLEVNRTPAPRQNDSAILGDGTVPLRGMRVVHPKGGAGRIDDVGPNGIVSVVTADGEGYFVPAHELRAVRTKGVDKSERPELTRPQFPKRPLGSSGNSVD